MAKLNSEMTVLLDKLYNLRGEKSAVLLSMDEEREKQEKIKESAIKEKAELEAKISELAKEEDNLALQGEKLKNLVTAFGKDDYSSVIGRLGLDFDPDYICDAIENTLPTAREKVASEKEETLDRHNEVIEELNDALTKIEELAIRKEEALANQERLNRYFILAVDGNINVTRDEITVLLEKMGFDEEEQREAAKLLMFPEDGIFEYEELRKENPGVEELASLKKKSRKTKEETDSDDEEEEEEVKEKKTKKTTKKADKEEKTEKESKKDAPLKENVEEPILPDAVEAELAKASKEEIPIFGYDEAINDEASVDNAIVDFDTPTDNTNIIDVVTPLISEEVSDDELVLAEDVKQEDEKEESVDITLEEPTDEPMNITLDDNKEETVDITIEDNGDDSALAPVIEEPIFSSIEEPTLTIEEPAQDATTSAEEPVVPLADITIPTIEEEVMPVIEDTPLETTEEAPVQTETPAPEVKEEPVDPKEDLVNLLSSLNLDYLDFKEKSFDKLLKNANNDVIKNNVELIDALDIKHDFFTDNVELLYDADLKQKITKLTGVGKLPSDIYLYPSILVKYNYSELESAIKVLEDSGLEPKKVPLIAY